MKTIKINDLELKLTPRRIQRINEEILDTKAKLNKELSYSKELQKKDMIDFYRAHIAKLEAFLS